MALYRMTFFFEQLENGWSESIHVNVSDTPTLITLSRFYVDLRVALNHTSTFLTHVRISDDQVFRDVILDPINLPRGGEYKPTGLAEGPWTAIDLRLQSNPLVNRSLFLRGFPAGQINSNQPNFTGNFQAALAAFLAQIVGAPWSIKAKDRTQVKQPINTISAPGVVNLTTPIVGLNQLDTVQILGIPRSVVPKRTYTVVNVIDGSNFTLRGWSSGAIAGRGYLKKINYLLYPINFSSTDFITERRVGRPFGVLRGRRAVVR